MSKGSNKRPTQVPRETFKENWDRIFTKREKKPEETGRKQVA